MNTIVLDASSTQLSIEHLIKLAAKDAVELRDADGRVVALVLAG